MRVLKFFKRLFLVVDGVTSIEYALLGGLIAVVIVGSVTAVGDEMKTMYDYISTEVQKAISGS
jgi:pilus assembly protein Flp/PilA